MKITYSSIVLYHHTAEEIEPTLHSLLSSSAVNSVILVDNGGCGWAAHTGNPRIKYIQSPQNGGFGYGHNQAIRKYAAESDFFLICNPDIYFNPKQLEQLLLEAITRPEGLFVPKIVYPDGRDQYGRRLLPSPLNLFARRFAPAWSNELDQKFMLLDYDITRPSFVPFLSGSFMLFRSSALLSLGGFDERYFMYLEDIDLSRRCAEQFGNCYLPHIVITHAHQQASYKNKKLRNIHVQSAIRYFNKWGWLLDSGRRKLNKRCLESLNGQQKI